MRKILSALAFVAAAFSAAFGVSNVYAAPSLPSGVVSGGIAGYCYVGTDSKVYANGTLGLSGTSGFSACAIANDFGACGLKPDGSLVCENGFTLSGVAYAEGGSMGGAAYADGNLAVVFRNGDFRVYKSDLSVRTGVDGGVTFARFLNSYGEEGSFYCFVRDGVAKYYSYYGLRGEVADASTCSFADVGGQWYLYGVKTDGTSFGLPFSDSSSAYAINAGFDKGGILTQDGYFRTYDWLNGEYVGSNEPDFPVRDAVLAYNAALGGHYVSSAWVYYAVRVSDGRLVTWSPNMSWALVGSDSVAVPPSGGGSSPLGEYCIESPSSSGSYVFTPKTSSSLSLTDSSWFGVWKEYGTDSGIKYRFKGFGDVDGSYFTGALLNSNSEGAAFTVQPDPVLNTAGNAYIEVSVFSGSINYLRVFGRSDGVVRYSAIFDEDGERTYQFLYERSTFGKYLQYSGDKKLVGWKMEFPNSGSLTFRNFEIGTYSYETVPTTRVTCYPKEEYDQLKNYGTGSSYTGSTLGSLGVGMSTYVGIMNGGTWTGTTGELYERVFSGSSDYSNVNPPENYTKVISSYFTKCEAPRADLGGFSFLSWGFEGTVPVVNYSFDFRPFTGLECPLRVVVSNYDTLKGLFYNR